MKKAISLLLAGAIAFSMSMPVMAEAEDAESVKIYVAQYGDDLKDGGNLTDAVATIERAQELARAAKSQNKTIEIIFKEGQYYLPNEVEFTSEDSGVSADKPIVYRAYQGDEVSFTRAQKLDGTKFAQTQNSLLNESVAQNIVAISLAGITKTNAQGDSLYVDGALKTLARWPNNQWPTNPSQVSKYASTVTVNANDGTGTRVAIIDDEATEKAGSTVYYERMDKWGDDAFLLLWRRPYSLSTETNNTWGESYTTTGDSPVTYNQTVKYGGGEYLTNPRTAVVNVLYELDEPGEYYVDYEAGNGDGMLYYYPTTDITSSDIYFMAGAYTDKYNSTTYYGNAFVLDGVENVSFENIKLIANADDAISMTDCNNINIYGVTIEGVGNYAITATGTENLLIAKSTICETKAKAIYVEGGDRDTLENSGNVIRNNKIYNYGRLNRTGGVGIQIDGVGVQVINNEIYNAPTGAINFAGNDHLIEGNRIHDVQMETWDSGAIYGCRSWVGIGTKIVDNYIYTNPTLYTNLGELYYDDIEDDPSTPLYFENMRMELRYGSGTNNPAIYIDDLQNGITVEGNIVYNMSMGAMFGGGSDNVFQDNLFVDTRHAYLYDNRGEAPHEQIDMYAQYAGYTSKEFLEFRENADKVALYEAYYGADFEATMDVIDKYEADFAAAGLVYPTKPNLTDPGAEPVEPVESDYTTTEDYENALELYETAKAAYDEYHEAMDKYEADLAAFTAANKPLLQQLGRVRNRTIDNNVCVGDWVRHYNELDENGNHWMHGSFLLVYGGYDSTGTISDGYKNETGYTGYETYEAAGITISDDLNITVANVGDSFGATVMTSTANVGVQETDAYAPHLSVDEFETDSNYRFSAVAAFYDGNKVFKGIQIFEQAYMYEGQEIDLDIAVPQDATSDWMVKLMIWDSISGLRPMATQNILVEGTTNAN